jgi:hypothetical protein
MAKFSTIAQVRKFLRQNGVVEFRGLYETYTLTDGRVVKFIDRATRNCWGLSNEASEMVEVA